MSTKIGAIVLSRFDSTRLPGKALRKVKNKPLIEYVIEKAHKVKGVNGVCVATSNRNVDDPIVDFCKQNQVSVFRGSGEDVAERFYSNLMKCDSGVYNRLTIENEDKGFFNIDNCIKFSEYLFAVHGVNIPVCADNLHHQCNPSEVADFAWQAERCAYTWVNQGDGEDNFLAPVFHWSEGTPEKPRAHADYFALGNFPPRIAIETDKPAKWECEVKGKDKAIALLRKNMFDKS